MIPFGIKAKLEMIIECGYQEPKEERKGILRKRTTRFSGLEIDVTLNLTGITTTAPKTSSMMLFADQGVENGENEWRGVRELVVLAVKMMKMILRKRWRLLCFV